MDFGAQNTNSRSEIFPRCGGPTLGLPTEIRQQIFQHLLTDHSSHKWRGLRNDGRRPERLYIRPNQHVIHYKFKTRPWILFGDYSSRSRAPALEEEVSSYFYAGYVKRTIQPQILRVCRLWLREGVCILYGGSGEFITLNTPIFIHKFLPDIGQVNSGNIRELKICLKIAAQVLPDDRISEGDTLQLLNGQEAVKESFPRAIEKLLRMGCLPELRKLELETLRSDGSLILTYPENNHHLDRFRGCLLQSTKIALKSERFRKVAWIERTSEWDRREVVHIRVTFWKTLDNVVLNSLVNGSPSKWDDDSLPRTAGQVKDWLLDPQLVRDFPLYKCGRGVESVDSLRVRDSIIRREVATREPTDFASDPIK